MAIYIEETDTVFLHIPKTAGSFIYEFLHKHFTCKVIDNIAHSIPMYLPPEYQDKKMFCFVRHPVKWYPSYWACMMTFMDKDPWPSWFVKLEHNDWATNAPWAPWHPTRVLEHHCGSKDFNQFVKNSIVHFPGFASYMYKLYTDHCFFVGRFENLIEDLTTLFDMHGIDVRQWLAEMPIVNESDPKHKEAAAYDPNLKALVEQLEVCEFYPDTLKVNSDQVTSSQA